MLGTIGTVVDDQLAGDSVAKTVVGVVGGLIGGGLLQDGVESAVKIGAEALLAGAAESVVKAGAKGVVEGALASNVLPMLGGKVGNELGSQVATKAWDALTVVSDASDPSLPFPFPQYYTQGQSTEHISPLVAETAPRSPPPTVPPSPSLPIPPSIPSFPPSLPSFPLSPPLEGMLSKEETVGGRVSVPGVVGGMCVCVCVALLNGCVHIGSGNADALV